MCICTSETEAVPEFDPVIVEVFIEELAGWRAKQTMPTEPVALQPM